MTRHLLALFLVSALSTAAQTTPTRYIVGTKAAGNVAAARMLQSDDAVRAHAVRAFDNVSGFAATLSTDEAAALRKTSGVRYVQPVVERHLLDAPHSANAATHPITDGSPYAFAQTVPYGIDLVHARDVWPVTRGKGPVHVIVFDTGIDLTHPDLKRAYAGGYNTFDHSTTPMDDHRHGTHVSGIIAATDNGIGVVGVAPDVDLWMVKVLDSSGQGSDENIIAAIDYTLQKKQQLGGNWIVSISLGSDSPSDPEAEAFAKLTAAGILPIAASGNAGFAKIGWPAAYPGVVAVGAIDSNSALAGFSSFGPELAVVAPGVDVLSTMLVGSVPSSSVTLSTGTTVTSAPLIGAKRADVTAPLVNCGVGTPEEIPSEVRGRIALMQRGTLTFSEKVRNVVAAGGIGAVIYNSDDLSFFTTWTLIRPDCTPDGCQPFAADVTFNWPVVVAISKADGQRLLASVGSPATASSITIGDWDDDYGLMSGTSMATPHVSGAAALAWSVAPKSSAIEIRNALVLTARDIETPGADLRTGWGVVDAAAAAKYLNPGAFGIPPPPPPPPRRHVTHP